MIKIVGTTEDSFRRIWKSHINRKNALFYNVCILSFRLLLHVSTLLSGHLQGSWHQHLLKIKNYNLLLYVINKYWFHLPQDGEIIKPKHVGVMWKIICIQCRIIHFGVTRVFHFVIMLGIYSVSAGYVPRHRTIRNVNAII